MPLHPDTRYRTLRGLGGLGQSQDYLNRIAAAQNAIAVLLSEMSEIGKDAWNKVSYGRAADFDWTQNELTARIKAIQISYQYTPPESAVSFAEARGREIRGWVDAIKAALPPAQAQAATAEGQKTAQTVARTVYRSPSEAGWREFQKSVAERAEALTKSKGLPWWGWAALALVAVGTGAKLLA